MRGSPSNAYFVRLALSPGMTLLAQLRFLSL